MGPLARENTYGVASRYRKYIFKYTFGVAQTALFVHTLDIVNIGITYGSNTDIF